ncbi:MAG TPA: hypothetical protein PKC72_01200 [Chitinophagaceae bacterium]|nr:hypothetical protein [Chitinophagaceae bacterium]
MFKNGALYIFLATIASLVLFSCSTQQKAQSRRNSIVAIDSQLIQKKNLLSDLDKQREKKLATNEMLDTASKSIQRFINKTKEEIQDQVTKDSLLIGETEVAREDWNKLKKSLTESQKSLKNITNRVQFIKDLLERNRVVKLDQDVIFKSGEYEVSPDIAASIVKFFEPAAAGVDSFIQKYPDFSLSLVITAKGYADGTTINENSKLYKQLKEQLKLQTSAPTNKDLNQELSNLRAKKVIELFQDFTTARSGNRQSNQHILYLYEGKGEDFPNPTIADYKTNDPRRRVVLLFWSIFPE